MTGAEQLLHLGQSLDVVHICVGGDQRGALSERKIELPDQFDKLLDRILVADVHQRPLRLFEDQIDAASDPLAGLQIQFENMRKDRSVLYHHSLPC